jgi:hypothetical protein
MCIYVFFSKCYLQKDKHNKPTWLIISGKPNLCYSYCSGRATKTTTKEGMTWHYSFSESEPWGATEAALGEISLFPSWSEQRHIGNTGKEEERREEEKEERRKKRKRRERRGERERGGERDCYRVHPLYKNKRNTTTTQLDPNNFHEKYYYEGVW